MKVLKQKQNGFTVSLSIEVALDELNVSVDRAFQKLGKHSQVPGFRKGKAPREIFESHYGKSQLVQEGITDAVDKAYQAAIKETDLKVVDYPKNIKIDEYKENEPLSFSCDVDVEPEVKLGKYKGVKVEFEEKQFQEADVDAQVDQFLQRFASFAEVDRPAADGDLVAIRVKALIDEVVFEPWTHDDYACLLGQAQFGPDFDQALIGLKKEEEKSFELDYPDDFSKKEVAGKKVSFVLTGLLVKEKVLPELDDEFVKKHGQADSAEAFKQNIRDNLIKQIDEQNEQGLRQLVIDEVIKDVKVDIPEGMVKQEMDYELRYYEQTLKQSKLDLDQYFKMMGKTKEAFMEEMKPSITKRVKTQLVLTELTQKEKVEVEESERLTHIKKAYPQLKTEEEQQKFLKTIDPSKLDEQVAQIKTVDFLVKHAKIKKTSK